MYRIDGSSDLKEDALDHWCGLPRVGAGADRQRRGRAAAARHLRRGAGQHLRRRPGRASRLPARGWPAISRRPRLARRQLGPAGRGHLGDPRRPSVVHLRAGDVLGRLRPRHPDGGRARTAGAAGALDRPSATGSTRRSWTRASTRAGRRSSSTTTPTSWTPSLLRMPTVGLHRRHRPAVAVDAEGHGRRSWSPTAWSTATTRRPRRTGSGGPRARSRCARSPTSTPSPAPAGSRTPGTAFEKMLTYANHVGSVLRGDRPDRRADRQLPAGLHAPGADRRGGHPRRGPGPDARLTRRAADEDPGRRSS